MIGVNLFEIRDKVAGWQQQLLDTALGGYRSCNTVTRSPRLAGKLIATTVVWAPVWMLLSLGNSSQPASIEPISSSFGSELPSPDSAPSNLDEAEPPEFSQPDSRYTSAKPPHVTSHSLRPDPHRLSWNPHGDALSEEPPLYVAYI